MNQLRVLSEMAPEEITAHDALVREHAERAEAERKAELAAKREATFLAMGIPPKDMALIKSGGLEPTEAVTALRGNVRLVCLSGNPGCGKTTAAGSWLWSAADGAIGRTRGIPVFVKAARLARWDRYDDEQMDRLLKADRLVVDDLGTEFQDAKGSFMVLFDELVDVRYDHCRPTVITTNLDAEQFKTRYGERIADRIREAGKFVSLAGASMRGQRK